MRNPITVVGNIISNKEKHLEDYLEDYELQSLKYILVMYKSLKERENNRREGILETLEEIQHEVKELYNCCFSDYDIFDKCSLDMKREYLKVNREGLEKLLGIIWKELKLHNKLNNNEKTEEE